MATINFLYYFIAAFIGHFVGDYLFQNQWMATRKSFPGKAGHIACTAHVLAYTFAIALFTGWHPLFLLAVFVPHWIIDRWSLANYWLSFKNGYTAHEVWEKGLLCAAPAPSQLEQNAWKVSFAAYNYALNDNTMHWVCLWFAVKYLLR